MGRYFLSFLTFSSQMMIFEALKMQIKDKYL